MATRKETPAARHARLEDRGMGRLRGRPPAAENLLPGITVRLPEAFMQEGGGVEQYLMSGADTARLPIVHGVRALIRIALDDVYAGGKGKPRGFEPSGADAGAAMRRVWLRLPAELGARVDAFRHDLRYPHRETAIQDLLRHGLRLWREKGLRGPPA